MSRIPASLCIRCKGYKKLCGLPVCPILEKFRIQVRAIAQIKGREVRGYTPPTAVVGEEGYPYINVFYMIPPDETREKAWYYDAPQEWALRGETLDSIVRLRSSLIAAGLRTSVHEPFKLYEKEISLALVSEKPVASEAVLQTTPIPRLRFDDVLKPIGPSSPAERIVVTENPSVPRPLEKIVWDDLQAAKAVVELYSRGLDVYTIQKALSLGLLGRLKNRKLVPTRWAITAVDDTVSRMLRSRVRQYEWLSHVEVRVWEHLGNRYVIVLMPGGGWFEWIELWHPRGLWTAGEKKPIVWRVVENPMGRVSEIDGGYSAARLAVLEYLDKVKRSADAIILREITPEYYTPVGNWQIREGIRLAFTKTRPILFSDTREAIEFALRLLNISPDIVKSTSPILRGVKQTRITEFLG